MNGKIVAVNRNLGVIVVQTVAQSCVVLEATGLTSFTVGEEVEGDWDGAGEIVVHSLSNGEQVHARVQKTNVSRSEAIGGVAII